MQQKSYPHSAQQQQLSGPVGLRVRSGLRGGVCVDVNDQVKTALQTLTNALGSAATVTIAPIATDTTAPGS